MTQTPTKHTYEDAELFAGGSGKRSPLVYVAFLPVHLHHSVATLHFRVAQLGSAQRVRMALSGI